MVAMKRVNHDGAVPPPGQVLKEKMLGRSFVTQRDVVDSLRPEVDAMG